MRRASHGTVLLLLVLLSVACFVLATALGSVSHSPATWWHALACGGFDGMRKVASVVG